MTFLAELKETRQYKAVSLDNLFTVKLMTDDSPPRDLRQNNCSSIMSEGPSAAGSIAKKFISLGRYWNVLINASPQVNPGDQRPR